MFKSLETGNAVPRVAWTIIVSALSAGLMTSPGFSQEEPVTVEGEVTIVETEIGLDQIVVQKKKASRPEKESPKAGGGAGRDKLLILGDPGPSLTSEKIVDLNRMLKKAIEMNQQLEADKKGIDQQLKNLRGQRTIEVNRIKSLGTERDSYKGMLEQSQKNMLKLREQISDLESKLADKDRQMDVMIAEPPVMDLPEGEGDEEALVEISARELNDLRQTIPALRRQILEREQAIAQMSGEQKAGAETELKVLSGQVAQLEGQLKNKDADYQARMAALQAAKDQAEEKAQALADELKNLEGHATQTQNELAQIQDKQQKSTEATSKARREEARVIMPESSAPAETSSPVVSGLATSQQKPRGQGLALFPETAAAPEVTFAPDERVLGDAAFQDRVRSQSVIAMLDQMSERNEGLRADEGRVHYNMGNIFFHQGDYERARDEFRMAVRLMPYDANAHFNLAFVSWEYLEDFKTALEHFQQYLWLNPEAEDASLVKEKIIAAQMEVMGSIDSILEKEVKDERMRRWKYTDVTNGRVGEHGK